MRYIDVSWFHDFKDEPVRLVCEIGKDDFEIRKLEFFRDGKVGFASENSNSDSTFLSSAEIPDLVEINSQGEFSGKELSKQEFESLWSRFGQNGS